MDNDIGTFIHKTNKGEGKQIPSASLNFLATQSYGLIDIDYYAIYKHTIFTEVPTTANAFDIL